MVYKNQILRYVVYKPHLLLLLLSSVDNYRFFSLFNSMKLMCRLFDNVILLMFNAEFNTSDMQFGYKEDQSTTLCTLVFKEVISNYIKNGSCVYACVFDASKAFDCVHYGKLFNILLSKEMLLSIHSHDTASGGIPMFPLVVHQPASPSIWPAVQSLRRGLSTNPGAIMWCVCGCS